MKLNIYLKKLVTSRTSFFSLLLMFAFFIPKSIVANNNIWTEEESNELVLNSHSFNASKRSSFTVYGQTETVERGLTIIHLKPENDFEFKTFDTYGSEEDAVKFLEVLSKMVKNKSLFAILAHDSAAAKLTSISLNLKNLGFTKLSSLKNREAYVMYNFDGQLFEETNGTSVVKSLNVTTPIVETNEYFPRIKYAFEPNNNRFIAHGAGEIDNVKYSNTKDALDYSYNLGFRMFELDIIKTSDGKWVAAHDWNMWARFTDYTGSLPPTHEEFKKHKIYGTYTTLDLNAINDWFAAHKDATLVTDKINDPVGFANAFVDKNRLIMELFSAMAVEQASAAGIKTMISQDPLLALKGDKINFLKVNNVKYVAVSRRIITSKTKLLLQLKEAGIKVYVYNVNFDKNKDEKYVLDNEIGLVYGMYADKWAFDNSK